MSLKKTFAKTLLVTSIASLLTACGGSSDKSTPTVEKTPVVEDSPLYLVKTTDWSVKTGITSLFLTDSVNSDTKFNAEDALVISGYHYVAVNESGDDEDAAFYLAVDNTPKLERYIVNDEGKPELDKELDFSAQGITDARDAMRAGKIFSADKGYFIDKDTMQVVVFNPTEMTITKTIDLSEYAEVDYPKRWAVFSVIDGDRVVIPITFYESNWTAAKLSKLVVIDTTTDTVTVDSSTLCGGVSGSAVDAAGNVYWASSPEVAVSYKLDPVNAAFAPCMIRMKSGAEGWDDSYYVNMTDLIDHDRPVYGVTTGDGYKGYTLVYSDEATPLTADNAKGASKASVWEFHSFDLEAPFAGITKIENALPTNSKLNSGVFLNDDKVTSWIDTVSSDYTESTIYDTTDSENWKVLLVVPGDLETISRIR